MHGTHKNRIVALYQQGHSIKSVAELTHHSTVTIMEVLREAGVDTAARKGKRVVKPANDWEVHMADVAGNIVQEAVVLPCLTAKERYYQQIADLGDWQYLTPDQRALRHEHILEIESQYRFEQILEAAGIPLDDGRDYDEDLELLLAWINEHKG